MLCKLWKRLYSLKVSLKTVSFEKFCFDKKCWPIYSVSPFQPFFNTIFKDTEIPHFYGGKLETYIFPVVFYKEKLTDRHVCDWLNHGQLVQNTGDQKRVFRLFEENTILNFQAAVALKMQHKSW